MNSSRWRITENIENTINIRCLFCRKFHFVPVPPKVRKWVQQSFPVLTMLTGGRGDIVVIDRSKTEIVNDLWSPCFLPSNIKRQPIAAASSGFEVLALGFSVEVLGGIDLLNFFNVPITFPHTEETSLKEGMLELFELKSLSEGLNLKQIAEQKRILFEIFGIIIDKASPKKEATLLSTETYGCLPAVKYLNEHFASPPEIVKLLKMCHFSQSHFFRLFKKLTGVTPFNYVKHRRIEEAQRLLLTTSLSVAEIGERVGWPDQFHFSRTFKSETNFSPQQYRKQFLPGK